MTSVALLFFFTSFNENFVIFYIIQGVPINMGISVEFDIVFVMN